MPDMDEPSSPAPQARVSWRVVLLSAGGAEVLPGQRLLLDLPMEPERVDVPGEPERVDVPGEPERVETPGESERVSVALMTRFEDVGLSAPLPRELILEVELKDMAAETAIAAAGAVAGGMVTLISFAVNAWVPPAEPFLAFESAPGLSRRSFWQREVSLERGLPQLGRRIDESLFFPFLNSVFGAPESARIIRALSSYHAALSQWTTKGQPLALAHLYVALEALGPAAERAERARLGLADEREHATHRGVDLTRSNWKEVLLGWVRRDLICKGDKATYDGARKASDGLEHGGMPLPEYRLAAGKHARTLMNYVRSGVLDLLDIPEEIREALRSKRPIDVSPLWQEISGELHGAVEDPNSMGESGQPYPYADWHTTLDNAERLDDGRLRITPRINLTMHFAEGVQLTATHHRTAVGLSDADLFEYEPSNDEPVVIRNEAGVTPSQEPHDS